MLRFENSEIASTREVLLSVRHWFCFEFRVHNISLPIMIQFLKAVRNDLGQYANYCAQGNDIPFSSATSRLHQIKIAESRVTSGFNCYYVLSADTLPTNDRDFDLNLLNLINVVFYRPQGKVMFSEASVCSRGVYLRRGSVSDRGAEVLPPKQACLRRGVYL